MTSFFFRSNGLVATCIIIVVAFSAKAQVVNDGAPLPDISRGCLWNGDRATWKTLGLNKMQIERLRQLRLLYPAVVDGQWVLYEDNGPPSPNDPNWVHGDSNLHSPITGQSRGASAPDNGEEQRTYGTTVQVQGLQNDIREVLTPLQIRNWARLCR